VKNPVHWWPRHWRNWRPRVWDEGNDYFPPTSWQISNFHAGTGADNVVPGTFVILFNFRFSTASTPDSLQARVHSLLDRHGVEYEIAWTLSGQALPDAARRTGRGAGAGDPRKPTASTPQLSTSGGTSDGRFIADICPQVIELGPLNATIHKIDECIAVADLEPLARIYERDVRKAALPMIPAHRTGHPARLAALGGEPLQRGRPAFRPRHRQCLRRGGWICSLHALHLPPDTPGALPRRPPHRSERQELLERLQRRIGIACRPPTCSTRPGWASSASMSIRA
jgi:hypothetical protein